MTSTKRLLKKVDVKKFLSRYKQLQWKESGNDLIMCCPFHKEKNPSFAFSFKGRGKGTFICYSGNCGKAGTLISFVSLMEDISYYEALKSFKEEYDSKRTYNLKAIREKLKQASEEIDNELKKIKKKDVINLSLEHEDVLSKNEQRKKLFKYLRKKRKYRNKDTMKKIIKKFDIKVVEHCKMGFSICIPIVFNNQTIAYYYERYGDRSRKLFSEGSKISKFLFHFKCKPIKKMIIVEGIWDAIKVWSTGLKNVTTCFTSRLSNAQAFLLNEHVDKVIIFFDGDRAGRDGSKKAKKLCEPVNDVYIIKTPTKKDPGELAPSIIRQKAEFAGILK